MASEGYPSGRTITTGYDATNRAVSVTGVLGGGSPTNYLSGATYAPQGGFNGYTYKNLLSRSYSYNKRLEVTDLRDTLPSYVHNLAGTLTSMTLPNTGRVISYGVDSAGRILTATGTLGGTVTPYVSSTTYAPHGALSSLVMPAFTESTVYNAQMQPFSIAAVKGGSSTLLSLQYSYCPGQVDTTTSSFCAGNTGNVWGQKVSFDAQGAVPSLSEQQTYAYDAFNRITGASTPNWTQNSGYTPWGNWYLNGTPTGLSAPTLQTPTAAGSFSAVTNRLLGWTYDEMGNLLSVPSTAGPFAYDAENRQVSGSMNGLTASYIYDGDGRRVQKSVGGGSPTTYVYDAQGQLAQEYGGPSMLSGPEYLSVDALGSTRLVTSASGVPQRRMDYLPFGLEILAGSGARTTAMGYNSGTTVGTSDVTSIKFTSKERDSETGLDYFGARYFSSAQGRFTSTDPVSGAPGDPQSWNMYAYARNNPLLYTDPDGQTYRICDTNGNCYGSYSDADFDRNLGPNSKNGSIFDGKGNQIGTYEHTSFDDLSPFGNLFFNQMSARRQASNQFIGAFAGGSLLGGGVVAGGLAVSGAGLTTLGLQTAAAAAPLLPAVPSAIDKLQKLGVSLEQAREIVSSPAAQKFIDNANSGNINVLQDVGGKIIRVTLEPTGSRIISAGIVQARNVTNSIASGRFTPLK